METAYQSSPVAEPLPQSEQNKIITSDDPWSDERALRIVKADFAYAESFRTYAHDWRYRNADELYLAWAGQRYWDGTRVPRSSLGIPLIFTQIHSLLPKISSQVTNPDGYHFYAEQELGEDEETIVTAWREMILKQLDETRFGPNVKRALHSMCQYGNAVLEVGMEEYEQEYIQFDRSVRASKVQFINHPIAGPTPFPSETKESFSRKVNKETKQRPYVRYTSLKDFYVDPNLESPFLQDAGYVMKRVYMRAEQIKQWRDQKGFKIPSDNYLTLMSHAKSTANQDITKQAAELYRYTLWNPAQDYTSDPSQKRIAVIEYTTASRKIWYLQGADDTQAIIYNQPNRYGEINYFSVPYADVLDRWHALAVTDVVEGEQRLQQAIINGRVDELALALHPPTVKRRGITIPAYQLKRRPGVVIETENPKEDVIQQEVMNITQQAFVEVNASDLRTQKITGMSDLAAMGTPSSGGNSANRSATGVNTQAGATQDRVKYLVEAVEEMLIEPVVNAVIRYDKKFLDMPTASNWLKLDKRFQGLSPEKVMNARIVSECRGSIKMAGRMGFLQSFPVLLQTYLNPEYLQLMAQTNQMTLDPKSVEATLWDAINYSPRNPWFVKMKPEQVQAMNQPSGADAVKAQIAQQQIQSDEKIEGARQTASLFRDMLKTFADGHQAYAELDDTHLQKMAQLMTDIHIAGTQAETAKQAAKNKPKPK